MKPRRSTSPRHVWTLGDLCRVLPSICIALAFVLLLHRNHVLAPALSAGAHLKGDAHALPSNLLSMEAEQEREVFTDTGAGPGGEKSPIPELFLFVGILSGRGYRHRRLAVREAWASKAQQPGLVVSKFVLSEDERTPQVQKEVDSYGDMVFVGQRTNYKSILYKTYFVMEYAVKNYDVKFILKTDDDAFVNVPPLIAQLHRLCETPDCVNERLYMGRLVYHSEVLLSRGHKWNNDAFHQHTGLSTYPTYAMGGGYVLSGEVARLLVETHERLPLLFTPIEDATVGFWLSPMDLRQVHHERFHTWAYPCCFVPPVRRAGRRSVTRFALAPKYETGLCSDDPWIVLHKIDSPTKMRFVGSVAANCSTPHDGISASLRSWYPAETQAMLDRRAEAVENQRLQAAAAEQAQTEQAQAKQREGGVEGEATSTGGSAEKAEAAVVKNDVAVNTVMTSDQQDENSKTQQQKVASEEAAAQDAAVEAAEKLAAAEEERKAAAGGADDQQQTQNAGGEDDSGVADAGDAQAAVANEGVIDAGNNTAAQATAVNSGAVDAGAGATATAASVDADAGQGASQTLEAAVATV